MEVVHAHCAGLDVHKDTVVACVRHMAGGKGTTTVRTFSTATAELLACRKTDVKDAAWLADLMAHGLVSGSFVPDQTTQEMRDLLRTRKQLVRERTSHTQRIQKTLECANIKLDSVISN